MKESRKTITNDATKTLKIDLLQPLPVWQTIAVKHKDNGPKLKLEQGLRLRVNEYQQGPKTPDPRWSDQGEGGTKTQPWTKQSREPGEKREKGRLEHIKGQGSTQGGYQASPYKEKAIGLGSTSHQH